MKNFIKALWLIALLCCGTWTANAGITLSGEICIPAGSSTNYTYSIVKGPDLSGFTVVSSVWSVEGGIENKGETLETVTIESGKLTDYNSSYSKYAKGTLRPFRQYIFRFLPHTQTIRKYSFFTFKHTTGRI
jgi:hypothetical protein